MKNRVSDACRTPWGRVSELRTRRLQPGPTAEPALTARNQRQRLMGAMFACVVELGYEETTVADLEAASGVSRRSFYTHFAGKDECLRKLVEEMVSRGISQLAADPPTRSACDAWTKERFQEFGRLIRERPRAARVCLVDAHAAGGDEPAAMRSGREAWEKAMAGGFSLSKERAGMPAEFFSVFVGAAIGIARYCVQKDRASEIEPLMARMSDLVLSYEPPPEPLRMATRPPRVLAEATEAPDHRERAIRALGEVAVEHGYVNVSVASVIARAGMSPRTFYANFSGKNDVMLAAIESAGARVVAAALPAFRRNTRWADGVRSAVGAILNFLAARPDLAQLLVLDAYAAGPQALDARNQALRPLEEIIVHGWFGSPAVQSIAPWAVAEGLFAISRTRFVEQGPESLPNLAPLITYLILYPFLGAGAACAAANGSAQSRGNESGTLGLVRRLAIEPFKREVIYFVSREPKTAHEVAEGLGIPLAAAEEHIDDLIGSEIIYVVDAAEKPLRFFSSMRPISDEEWNEMDLVERERISARIGSLIASEVEMAVEAGSFDARPDRHLSRNEMRLDPRGWREMLDLHDEAMLGAMRVKRESEERLKRNGERGSSARTIQAFFEMPEP